MIQGRHNLTPRLAKVKISYDKMLLPYEKKGNIG